MSEANMLTPEMTHGSTLAGFIRTAMRRWPDREALVGGGVRWTYAELGAEANRFARYFRNCGLKRGDAVALLSGNTSAVIAATQAVQILGLRYTPLHPMGSEDDHAFVIEDAGITTLMVDADAHAVRGRTLKARMGLKRVLTFGPSDFGDDLVAGAASFDGSDVPIEAQPEDITSLNYTGGTTGRPKGVVHRHRSTVAMMTQELAFWEWPQDVRFLVATPLSHAAGAMMTPTLVKGGTFVFLKGFDPAEYLATIARERITATFMVPTMLYALLDYPGIADADLSSLEMLIYGAAPASPARLEQAIKVFGPILCQLYGQSEAPQTISYLAKADHLIAGRLGSCGLPVPCNQVRLITPDGRDADQDEPGEICFRGPTIMEGYWSRPEESAAAFRDGWLRTGDIARRDADGYLHIVDRSKDMIITGGFNVYPREIEDCLAQHPAVAMCAVVGVPDDKWGEAVKAVVVLKSGAMVSGEELVTAVRTAKGVHYAPKIIEFVESLPHTAVGKLDRKAIRAMSWQGQERLVG
ncbi:AMP-binding protein [Sphingomonas paeninsulae]|nr:AMP-binding protein [Sphingomonas paeninsulae]